MTTLLTKDNNKLVAFNQPIDVQIKVLEQILFQNQRLKDVLTILSKSELKNYYIAAGCINQIVFNYYHGNELNFGIEDFDIVYFDYDLSYEKEDKIIKYVADLLKDIPVKLDIKNEARVHLWYEKKFDNKMDPYLSVEDAISSWGTSVTCIGVRLEEGKLIVCAPHGLNDLFSMTIRPTKRLYTQEQYQIKTEKWKKKWPLLNVMPWND